MLIIKLQYIFIWMHLHNWLALGNDTLSLITKVGKQLYNHNPAHISTWFHHTHLIIILKHKNEMVKPYWWEKYEI